MNMLCTEKAFHVSVLVRFVTFFNKVRFCIMFKWVNILCAMLYRRKSYKKTEEMVLCGMMTTYKKWKHPCIMMMISTFIMCA